MNKVLIYSSDYDFIQTLNDELKDYTSISIFYFFDIHEIIEKIKKTQFELVIIDLNKNYEKINFKYLSEINSDNIVFLYNKLTELRECITENPKFIIREKTLENVKNILDYNVFTDEESILLASTRRRIMNEIKELKFEITNIGVQYLAECVLMLKCDDKLSKLEKEVYPKVARKYGVSAKRVKWNIYSCISTMCRNNTYKDTNRYFGFEYNRAPTPKMLIFTIIHKL